MRAHRFVLSGLVVAVILLLAAVKITPAGASPAASLAQEPAVQEIVISAKKYEYTPNKIDIPLNATVRFKITAQDRDHGFEIEGVKDSCVKIPKGETRTVDYKATKAGPVTFKCCDYCGLGHGKMKGTITVK